MSIKSLKTAKDKIVKIYIYLLDCKTKKVPKEAKVETTWILILYLLTISLG